MKIVVISIILFFVSFTICAQAPKYSNDFLASGIQARGMAMGNAMVANTIDLGSGYWNAAGLGRMENNRQISAMHAEYFAGIANYDYLGVGFKVNEQSAASVNFIRMGIDNIPNTLALIDPSGNINYSNISSFSATDFAALLGYGFKSENDEWSFGGNAKIIRRIVGNFGGAWGFGFDLGAQYQNDRGLKFGANLKDVGSTVNFWRFKSNDSLNIIFSQTGNVIPKSRTEITVPRLQIGLGYLWEINDYIQLYSEGNLLVTTDGKRNTIISSKSLSIDPMFGLELGYQDLFFLRAGINQFQRNQSLNVSQLTDQSSFQPNIGIGIHVGPMRIDYALTNVGNQSSFYTHIISLTLGIDQ